MLEAIKVNIQHRNQDGSCSNDALIVSPEHLGHLDRNILIKLIETKIKELDASFKPKNHIQRG